MKSKSIHIKTKDPNNGGFEELFPNIREYFAANEDDYDHIHPQVVEVPDSQ